MNKSNIKSIGQPTLVETKFGSLYYRDIELENGDKGRIGTKSESPDWLVVGKELNYTLSEKGIVKRAREFTPSRTNTTYTPKPSGDLFPISSNKMVYMDIETCSRSKDVDSLPQEFKDFFHEREDWWKKRFNQESKEMTMDEIYFQGAPLVAEYSDMLVVSLGWLSADGTIITKSYDCRDINKIREVRDLLDEFEKNGYWVCGHHLAHFDIPLFGKKCLEHGIRPPKFCPVFGQKPWELKIIDTKQYYQFGNTFALGGIDVISVVTGIETSKDGEVKGSNLNEYWWNNPKPQEEKFNKIAEYCERDVEWLVKFVQYIENLD